MGLFSTVLWNTATTSGSNSGNDNKVDSKVSKTTNRTTTTLPTIVQLYINDPIPFIAVDTALVAIDVLDYNDSITNANTNNTTPNQQQQQQQQQQGNKRFLMMKRYSMNSWITNLSRHHHRYAYPTFAPLQYYAVQCIPPQEYTNHSASSATTNVAANSSDKSIVSVILQQLELDNSSTSTAQTTIPTHSLRNATTSYQQKQYFNEMSTKYVIPDLSIYNCRCSNTNTKVSSPSASSSSFMDTIISLTSIGGENNKSSSNVYCIVVDMSSVQQYATIETNITMIQQLLVRYLIQVQHSTTTTGTTAGSTTTTTTTTSTSANPAQTSLHQLRTVQFGLANQDTTTTTTTVSTSKDTNNDGSDVCITLQICVLMDRYDTNHNNSSNDVASIPLLSNHLPNNDYTIQQLKHLFMYHLRKYAAALNATLLFVSCSNSISTSVESTSNTGSTTSQPQQPTIHVREIPWIWKAYANGQPIWKYNSITAIEAATTSTATTSTSLTTNDSGASPVDDLATTTNVNVDSNDDDANSISNIKNNIYSLIYGPDNHNTEFIESVLARNANYPGHWDANVDSIWKIVPPPSKKSDSDSNTSTNQRLKNNQLSNGDQTWFKELYDTIVPIMGSSANTPAGTTTPTTATPGQQQQQSLLLQTPPPVSNKKNQLPPSTGTKTPNDAAVSSFFEDLLK